MPLVHDESLFGENIDFEYPASSSSADTDPISKVDVDTQTEYKSQGKRRGIISLSKQLVPKTAIVTQVSQDLRA